MSEQVIPGAPVAPPPAEPVPLPPVPEVIHVSPGAPQAEPGSTTSEWKAGIAAFAANTLALAVALGVPLSQFQENAILAWVGSTTTLAGLWIAFRSVRKTGTQG